MESEQTFLAAFHPSAIAKRNLDAAAIVSLQGGAVAQSGKHKIGGGTVDQDCAAQNRHPSCAESPCLCVRGRWRNPQQSALSSDPLPQPHQFIGRGGSGGAV